MFIYLFFFYTFVGTEIDLPWLVDAGEFQSMLENGEYLSYENRLSLGRSILNKKTKRIKTSITFIDILNIYQFSLNMTNNPFHCISGNFHNVIKTCVKKTIIV